eukprot:TRINITY_DN29301_c0_g1_i1.p3 TRINITY_DN29301_c0_g1~~TRINITY_DN29301_c0_g1_i1.p3  ORF type:complete len:113 (+),score=5.66 TRINITY_DN29301_c0_g1_i1:1496-1834(+)
MKEKIVAILGNSSTLGVNLAVLYFTRTNEFRVPVRYPDEVTYPFRFYNKGVPAIAPSQLPNPSMPIPPYRPPSPSARQILLSPHPVAGIPKATAAHQDPEVKKQPLEEKKQK